MRSARLLVELGMLVVVEVLCFVELVELVPAVVVGLVHLD